MKTFGVMVCAMLSAANAGAYAWAHHPISLVAAVFCGLTAIGMAVTA